MTKKIPDPERQLAYLAYVNRENDFQHHAYADEMKQYRLMQAGDPEAVEESRCMMQRNVSTRLSQDPLRNIQYLFIANITIATRFAIEGGLPGETAYNASDMYIRKMDLCGSVDEVMELHREMYAWFTQKMAGLRAQSVYSRPVAQCLHYIDANLHTAVRLTDLANTVSLSPSYLSTVFKKETGLSVSEYVMRRKIDTACNMLRYSGYSASQIGEILAFSSQSHFIRCFRSTAGITPYEYRQKHYDKNIEAARKHTTAEKDREDDTV